MDEDSQDLETFEAAEQSQDVQPNLLEEEE